MADDRNIGTDDTAQPDQGATRNIGGARRPSRSLEIGVHAGDYAIVRHLGGGAMGDVYEGVHEVIGKRVAIKVIKHVLADSDDAAERFVREARAVNRVNHPNVLDVFAFGKLDDGRLYLVMDLLDGESLGDSLRRNGRLSLDDFRGYFDAICDAVAAAHNKEIIHRDIKPDNVFLAEREGKRWIYVLDFGIAKMLSDAGFDNSKSLTGDGVWVGTPAYMAPEQWTASGIGPAADIYALGIMAYQMLTGDVPYQADSVPGMMEKHFHAEMPKLTLSETDPRVTPALDAALRRALAKAPEDRFDSVEEFREAVDAALQTEPPRAQSRNLRVATALLAVTALGAGVAAVVALPEEDSTEKQNANVAGVDPQESLVIDSNPRGARLFLDGVETGVTPYTVDTANRKRLHYRLTLPGYKRFEADISLPADGPVVAPLTRERGFVGTWTLSTGESRSFKLDDESGEVIVGYLDPDTSEAITFNRWQFAASEDPLAVVFGGIVPAVDPRAPEEPSCRFDLRSEYRYRSKEHRLELRRQRVKIGFDGEKCERIMEDWTDWERAQPSRAERWAVAPGAGPVRVPLPDTMLEPIAPGKEKFNGKAPPEQQQLGESSSNSVRPSSTARMNSAIPSSVDDRLRNAQQTTVEQTKEIPEPEEQRAVHEDNVELKQQAQQKSPGKKVRRK